MSFDELRALDAGNGEKIPTLQEVCDLVDKKIKINIELKGAGTAEPIHNFIEEKFNEGWTYDHFFVSSFDHHELKKFKNLNKMY
jgi:glycerophosphoryl diester phosphodiesterase